MDQEVSLLKQLKSLVLYLIVFLLPLFFLPFTQEFFATNKMYFLFFGSLLLLTLATFEFLLTKKLVWEKKPFDNTMILFFFTAVISVVVSSPNKVQAILNPNFGILTLFSYLIVYFFLSREKQNNIKYTLVYISAIITSLVTVFYFFNPLKNVALPAALQFLKNPNFSLQGNLLETVLFLGFATVLAFSQIFAKHIISKNKALPLTALTLGLVGLAFNIFSFVKTSNLLILPPYNLSWYSAVETLKQPVSALFGVGLDNFSSMFTRVKDAGYNASSLWQVGSFNVSSSTVLHIFTEMGVVGLIAFGLILLQLLKQGFDAYKHKETKYEMLPILYLVIIAIFLPPSLTFFYLLLLMVSHQNNHENNAFILPTDKILPLYAAVLILSFLFIGVAGYFVGRTYAAEVYFKRSLDGFTQNNVKIVYDNMRTATIMNPYIERFRSNFSQTNLLIANNIASKAQPKTAAVEEQSGKTAAVNSLSDQDRQTISQALQAAIEEAKATVTLNPQKAVNWENLANIYRNIINVAQGADSWTVSAYQRAIILDPQNPAYRVALGGVLFSLKNYDEASKLFEQAVVIKPDWANSYYNLAWASFQKQDYQRAALAMQSTISLLDPKKDEADYKRASADLEEFKKKLPKTEEATSEAATKPSKLSVPTPAVQSLEPKIKLPKEASPEAK